MTNRLQLITRFGIQRFEQEVPVQMVLHPLQQRVEGGLRTRDPARFAAASANQLVTFDGGVIDGISWPREMDGVKSKR